MNHDLVVIIGAMPSYGDKELLKRIENSKIALISVMEDTPLMERVEFFSRYEAGSEEGVISILTKEFLKEKELPKELMEYFENLDEGYISAETNIGEEEIEELHSMIKSATSPLIILGVDLFLNPRYENITRFINLLMKYSDVELLSLGKVEKSEKEVPQEIEELESFNGTVVFGYNSDEDTRILRGSRQFSVAAKVVDGQAIEIKIDNTAENRKFVLDNELKGTIALMPSAVKSESYRFKVAKIIKREVQ